MASPFEVGSLSASVDGAVVRGVAVAPRIPPDALDDGAGVSIEDGAGVSIDDGPGVSMVDGAALGEVPGEPPGEVPGESLGAELADELGLGVGQGGTVRAWMTEPSENVIRYVAGGTSKVPSIDVVALAGAMVIGPGVRVAETPTGTFPKVM